MQKYQYEPVSEEAFEVRFLILMPGEREDPVQGLLLKRSLTKETFPAYEALSYTWGSPDDPMEVAIRTSDEEEVHLLLADLTSQHKAPGFESGSKLVESRTQQSQSNQSAFRTVTVTQNLGHALPYLRLQDKPRMLWIDAICVNQENLPERSRQVQRMADVYRLASRAVVWLGEESDNSGLAIRILKDIAKKVHYDYKKWTLTALSRDPSDAHWADRGSYFIFEPTQTSSVVALFRRSWFHRLWILQEIHLASSTSILACGGDLILWQDFRNSVGAICLKGIPRECFINRAIYRDYHTLLREMESICKNISQMVFDQILEVTKQRQCTDQRDRIYALLSLSSREEIYIKPDYTKTMEQVFEIATRNIFHKANSIDFLSYCELNPQRRSELPSWARDFSVPSLSRVLGTHFGGTTLGAPAWIDRGQLGAQGIHILTIRHLYESRVFPNSTVFSAWRQLKRLLSELEKERVHYSLDRSIENVIDSIITSEFAEHYFPFLPTRPSISKIDEFIDYISSQYDKSESQEVEKYLKLAMHVLPGRKLFTSIDGRIGLCPQFAKQEDILVLLVGCNKPLILRPQGNEKYLVVGEAYYHGIMSAEPFLGQFPPDVYVARNMEGFTVFVDRTTGTSQCEDPRRGELPSGWSRVRHDREENFSVLLDEKTGKKYMSYKFDPRTFPLELEKRGVKLQDFTLV